MAITEHGDCGGLFAQAHAGSVPLQTAASGLIMGLSNDGKYMVWS